MTGEGTGPEGPDALARRRRERLDPEILAVVEARAAGADGPEASLAELRAAHDAETAELSGTGPAMAEERRLAVPRPDGGEVALATYRPPSDAAGPLPVVVYCHGGGWVVGSLEAFAPVCRALAAASGALVATVDYRLAPEASFPAGLEDCLAATTWLGRHAGELGADPARLGLAGDSAGANLATVVARRLCDGKGAAEVVPRHQALVYPVCDAGCDTPSYTEFAEGWGLTADGMRDYWRRYARDADTTAADLSPLRADDLAGLPPAWVLTAECDVLRDEGEAYAERLRRAGVAVVARRYPGTVHGFWRWGARVHVARRAVAEAGAAIAAAL